ncbi:hypothetical protein GE09DRAFT_113828 [Coniochaeta sp. 2T2.1]|nr:hypothetical protein GE09DRAFT_113828 [Coniochaeta sp. 2T2.1]
MWLVRLIPVSQFCSLWMLKTRTGQASSIRMSVVFESFYLKVRGQIRGSFLVGSPNLLTFLRCRHLRIAATSPTSPKDAGTIIRWRGFLSFGQAPEFNPPSRRGMTHANIPRRAVTLRVARDSAEGRRQLNLVFDGSSRSYGIGRSRSGYPLTCGCISQYHNRYHMEEEHHNALTSPVRSKSWDLKGCLSYASPLPSAIL